MNEQPDKQKIHVVLEAPAAVDVRSLIAGLQSYLERWGAKVDEWRSGDGR